MKPLAFSQLLEQATIERDGTQNELQTVKGSASYSFNGPRCQLDTVVVPMAFRGQGASKEIVQLVYDDAKVHGCRAIGSDCFLNQYALRTFVSLLGEPDLIKGKGDSQYDSVQQALAAMGADGSPQGATSIEAWWYI